MLKDGRIRGAVVHAVVLVFLGRRVVWGMGGGGVYESLAAQKKSKRV